MHYARAIFDTRTFEFGLMKRGSTHPIVASFEFIYIHVKARQAAGSKEAAGQVWYRNSLQSCFHSSEPVVKINLSTEKQRKREYERTERAWEGEKERARNIASGANKDLTYKVYDIAPVTLHEKINNLLDIIFSLQLFENILTNK